MKTKYFFLAALGALALTSCVNDEFVGADSSPAAEAADGAINFGFNFQNVTRADQVGVDAATTLQNQFIVYGTKHASAEAADASNDEVVFQNYVVEYEENSAGHTASNTHNWEYVGKTHYDAAKVSPAITGSQAIKYWDYSAVQGYTFYGIASKADIATNNKVTVTKTTTGTTVYDKGYSVVLSSGANLDQLFVADRKPVAKTDFNKPVTLTFRNFGARVRVGFYETIPGYTVTINKFYADDDAATAITSFAPMADAKTTFTAALQNISTTPTSPATNTMTVSYYDNTDASIENHVKLTASTVDYDYNFALGNGVVGSVLGTSAASPTWDNSGNYTTVYPFEANTNPMLIKVDYTLTAEDGASETIVVQGANVVVPTQYVKWKSNFAYTYLFKISDNTNGTTDGTTQGLYPITFDAVTVAVADDNTQETVTTFEDYSVTTYANGSKVTTNDEYKAGEDIYVVKTNNSTGAVIAPTAIGASANNAQVYVATTTGDVISEATVKARLTGSPNGITLTATTSDEIATLVQNVPAADGTNYDFGTNGAVKFTPSPAAAATYVYVFTRTANVAPGYNPVGSGTYSGGTTYYFKTTGDVYYPAEGINAGNFDTYKASLYTQTSAGTAGEYDIKVIKVNP
ncbi:MAG: hypothetical protein IJ700_08755 [Bacteroidaceae bacterium]|nr:hypothetical protein [Bacteroidaceae bacterium]MBR1683420.1 hypothetical protein [Bacteroidaceae bacterium]